MTDQKETSFKRKLNTFLEKIDQLEADNEEDETAIISLLKENYEELLGMGSFDKLYEQAPNYKTLAGAFLQIVKELSTELESFIIPEPLKKMMAKSGEK